MFRSRPDAEPARVAVVVEGRTVLVPAGASAAAAFLLAGIRGIRRTPVADSEGGPFCMMGICFDCLAEIDGVPNRQACMVEARPGMRIRRQIRERRLDASAE